MNTSPLSGYILSYRGTPVKALSFIPSTDEDYINVYAQYDSGWEPLNIGLKSIPTLQQVRDMNRNIMLNKGSYEDAHFYLRSAEGNNATTAFYTDANGGAIQSGDTDSYIPLNLQPLGGLLTYGGNEVATKNWVNSTYIKQGGNSFGSSMSIGTNDNNTVIIKVNGIAQSIFGSGFLSNNAYVNNVSGSNARLDLLTTGAVISRDVADSNTTLNVNKINASSTGYIQTWQLGSTTKAGVDYNGFGRFNKINIGSALASPVSYLDLDAGTVASNVRLFWFKQNGGDLSLFNNSSTSGVWGTVLRSTSVGVSDVGMRVISRGSATYSNAALTIEASDASGAAITSGNLLKVINGSTAYFSIDYAGLLTVPSLNGAAGYVKASTTGALSKVATIPFTDITGYSIPTLQSVMAIGNTTTLPLVLNTTSYDVDGTAASGNVIPNGLHLWDTNGFTNLPTSGLNTILTIKQSSARAFQIGTTGSSNLGLYYRGLHSTVANTWKRIWSDSDFTSTNITNWNQLTTYNATNTDIIALVAGTTSGTWLKGQPNGHIVFTIDGNDASDSFNILTNTSTSTTSEPMTTNIFSLTRAGVLNAKGRFVWDYGTVASTTPIAMFNQNGGWVSIRNHASASTTFQPRMDFVNTSTSTTTGALFQVSGSDTYTNGAFYFRTYDSTGAAALASGRTFALYNGSTFQFLIDYAGIVTIASLNGTVGYVKADANGVLSKVTSIPSTDISGLSTGFIQNQTTAIQTGGFRVSGSGQALNLYAGAGGLQPNIRIYTDAALTGASNAYGVRVSSVVQTDVTAGAYGFSTNLSTIASTFNLSFLRHYYASQSTIGAGSTVGQQYGFLAESNLTGAASNYGFYGALPANGTANWNLYMNGTAPNYMNGKLGIGSNVLTTANLRISLSVSGSNSYNVIISDGVVQSDVTSTVYNIQSALNTAAASFTLASYNHHYAGQGTIGAGSSVTSQYGYVAHSSMIGAASNYGFRGLIPLGSNNNWNLYMDGSAPNWLAGNLSIGNTNGTILNFHSSAVVFPSLAPSVSITTGTTAAGYNEGIVIRHNAPDATAVLRETGLIIKLSNESSAGEASKSGAITMSSANTYANNPDMNFYIGNDATPKMKILNTGGIRMSSLAGTGTRIVTVDINGTLSNVSIVPVANGGTGAATLTGYIKGNGTSVMTAITSIPFTDITGYSVPTLQQVATAGNNYTGDLVLGSTGNQVYVGAGNGTENTRLGKDAMSSVTTGDAKWNTAVGSGALRSLTSGYNNTAIGEGAMYDYITDAATAYQSNTAIGDIAMSGATAGVGNVALGAATGSTNGILRSRGNYNTFLGTNAGRNAPSGSLGDLNLFIGYNAGAEGLLGSYLLRIGSRANGTTANAHIIEGSMVPGAETLTFNSTVTIRDLPSSTGAGSLVYWNTATNRLEKDPNTSGYIINQSSAAQTASAWISGAFTTGSLLTANTLKVSALTGTGTRIATIDASGNMGVISNNFLTAATGTTNRITVTTGTTTPVIDIASTYVGQTSITTLGTIATGVWNGTTIAVNKGGTGASSLTGVIIGNGTSAMTGITGTSGQLLRRNNANTGYEFWNHNFVVTDDLESSMFIPGCFGDASYNPNQFFYTRVGNLVQVWGSVYVSAIPSLGNQSFLLDLPIPTTINSIYDLSGVVTGSITFPFSTGQSNNYINGYIGGNQASVSFSTDEANAIIYVHYGYVLQ